MLEILHKLCKAALDAVDAERAVKRCLQVEGGRLSAGRLFLDLYRFRKVFLLGVGKAAASMAGAVE